MNYPCYQITLQMKHFYTNRERCEVLTEYHLDAGVAVTGRMRDIGQNVLQSSFQTGSSSSPSCFHIFFCIAFLEEVFIRNIIQQLYYAFYSIIIVCINTNNAVIHNLFKTSRSFSALQNSSGHAIGFLRNLQRVWSRALKKVRQPWPRD